MKFLISILIFFPVVAIAGGSRVGTLGAALSMSRSGSYTKYGMGEMRSQKPLDLVRSLGTQSDGMISFEYKRFDSNSVEKHSLYYQQISEKYIDAIKRSQDSLRWEPVEVEELEN